ncbi:Subtilase family protein [Perilla frutescens var. hirtella]|nr:Subtilase family protein [Perilla frutescens var. hirtella]
MQVLATIRAHGFTGFIDPKNVPPSQFLPTSSTGRCVPNPDYQIWLSRDQFLLSWLLSSISEAMLGYLTRCHTTCDLWTARIMQLHFQLQTTRKDDLSVDDYFLKMRGFADLLAGAGHPIADDELVLYILAGFGPEYEAIDEVYTDDGQAQWIVDSGATNHITNEFQTLNIRSAVNNNESLTVGNGQQIPIVATGKAMLSNGSHSLLLNNILYVPQITQNLLSISQFTKDNGVLVEFHDTACFVKDKVSHQVLMTGVLEKGLYKLDLSMFPLKTTNKQTTVKTTDMVSPKLNQSVKVQHNVVAHKNKCSQDSMPVVSTFSGCKDLVTVVGLPVEPSTVAQALADPAWVAAMQAYIVYMGARKQSDIEQITKYHHEMLASAFESKAEAIDSMIYSYRHGFSGFAAKMSHSQAKYFQGLQGVVDVFPNYLYKQQTTRSWDYLGLSVSSTTNLLHDTNQGDGAIIGVLDSGVWPESESFNDKGLGPIPSKWKGYCESGDRLTPSKHCNKKLIGARYFVDGLAAELNQNYQTPYNASENDEYASARDKDGHGTHCASIAGGSFVSNVSANDGLAGGTARGGAPKARIAMYKVLWGGIGSAADILKAFDEAIHDGVDVLSLSLGFDSPLYPEIDKRDIIYYGTFHAAEHGIVPVCSAGNSGPLYGTVEDVAPWVITVAASTIDRSFPNPIILGNNQVFAGQGMYIGDDTGFVDLVFFEDRKPPLPPT